MAPQHFCTIFKFNKSFFCFVLAFLIHFHATSNSGIRMCYKLREDLVRPNFDLLIALLYGSKLPMGFFLRLPLLDRQGVSPIAITRSRL